MKSDLGHVFKSAVAGPVRSCWQSCTVGARFVPQDPVDLQTMGERVDRRFYTTVPMFAGVHTS